MRTSLPLAWCLTLLTATPILSVPIDAAYNIARRTVSECGNYASCRPSQQALNSIFSEAVVAAKQTPAVPDNTPVLGRRPVDISTHEVVEASRKIDDAHKVGLPTTSSLEAPFAIDDKEVLKHLRAVVASAKFQAASGQLRAKCLNAAAGGSSGGASSSPPATAHFTTATYTITRSYVQCDVRYLLVVGVCAVFFLALLLVGSFESFVATSRRFFLGTDSEIRLGDGGEEEEALPAYTDRTRVESNEKGRQCECGRFV